VPVFNYYIKDYYDNSLGVNCGAQASISGQTPYNAGHAAGETAGKNSVTITKGSWSGNQCTFSKSAGTANTQGVRVGVSGSWSNDAVPVYNYYIKDYYDNSSGVNCGAQASISGQTPYNAGRLAVTIGNVDWEGTTSGTTGTDTVSDIACNTWTRACVISTAGRGTNYENTYEYQVAIQREWSSSYTKRVFLRSRRTKRGGAADATSWTNRISPSSFRVDASDVYTTGYNAGVASVTPGSASNLGINYKDEISGYTNVGSFKRSNLDANCYIRFKIAASNGNTKWYYITVNA